MAECIFDIQHFLTTFNWEQREIQTNISPQIITEFKVVTPRTVVSTTQALRNHNSYSAKILLVNNNLKVIKMGMREYP